MRPLVDLAAEVLWLLRRKARPMGVAEIRACLRRRDRTLERALALLEARGLVGPGPSTPTRTWVPLDRPPEAE